jgi:hypothetical protein
LLNQALLVALQDTLRRLFPRHPSAVAIAEEVGTILMRAVDMVAKSGAPTDPAVWHRAFIASASEFASEETATRWLALTREP